MAERKIWFITRPERDPKFHRDALLALAVVTNRFTIKWSGNRQAHLNYEQILYFQNIKRENVSNDGSGGRTWAAMLKTFAYVFTDEEGYLRLTKVGRKIIHGEKVRENVTKQILTLQIPNAYFLESGFRPQYESRFRIRPARFVIKLANQPQLDYYLTKEEITFFALTAKTDSELATITEKIMRFRVASVNDKEEIKQKIAEDFDHRERSDKEARNYESAHGDVAHTFMLICDYTGLAEYIRGEALRVNTADSKRVSNIMAVFDDRYPFNTRYLISPQRMAENNGLDIDSYKASSYGEKKPASNKAKTVNKIKELLSDYPVLDQLPHEEIKNILMKELSKNEAEKHADAIKKYSYSALNNDFVEAYLNQTNNKIFEDNTGELFKAIGFNVEMRPKPTTNVQTEIEILLKVGNKLSFIIDAKMYRPKFSLSANLVSHMASEYIPNYEGYDDREVTYFGYITVEEWSGEKNLEKISKLVKRVIPDREIKGIMLSAKVLLGFLDYCIDNALPKHHRVELFLQAIDNKAFSTIGEFLRYIKWVEFSDCLSDDVANSELYIVTEDFACDSAKRGRDHNFQAVLPFRDNIINNVKAKIADIFKSEEFNRIINTIGAGSGSDFNLEDINYSKIIIMTNADVNGVRMQALLLDFFYRYMKPLVKAGKVFIVQQPLYQVKGESDDKKLIEYAWNDEELQELLVKFERKCNIRRYKGLGELDSTELWETTMNPDSRKVIQMNLEDAMKAENIFETLMKRKIES
ncbi:restriction endonuclease [Priestia aryabhattai]|uniref:toprim domain-containing protein n=1 Tax=Priestia aryabhattai TaxID=412384 RepID=UPI001C8E245C|nr:toprim domain-containing protein [Priestia aryabhattai]MBY0001438.1 restriction endonuclease [Priestia aryabhattai]